MANQSGDNITYEKHYNSTGYEAYDWLWGILINCGKIIGLDFYQFKAVIVIISIIIMYSSLKDETTNFNFITFMYLISFVFMDSQVLRNFIAMCILMYSIKYLKNFSNKKNILKFIICLIIATGIHAAFIIYSIFLLILVKEKKGFRKIIATIGFLMLIITIISGNVPFLNSLLNVFNFGEKNSSFITRTKFGGIPVIILHLFSLLIIKKLCYRVKEKYSDNQMKLLDTVYFIDICLVSCLPFVMLSIHFYRLIKNVVILNYAVLGNSFYAYKKIDSKIVVFLGTLVLALGWLFFETSIYSNFEDIIVPVLQ